jgi:DNA-binding MarR family transcriptional regulator
MIDRATGGTEADRIWQMLIGLVMDTRGEWRRKVTDATGLPFSRVRILWRLLDAPKTLKQLADITGIDAPATTVAVNDLENRGLVERHPLPDDRRTKLVSRTPAGQQLVEHARLAVRDEAPPSIQNLSKTDLAHLRRILEQIQSAER